GVTTITSPRAANRRASYVLPLPVVYPPPCSQTITGNGPSCCGLDGTVTSRNKQSSEPICSPASICTHGSPGSVASATPRHGRTGAGGRHRRAPVGGRANRMPENSRTVPSSVPRIQPESMRTSGSDGWASPAPGLAQIPARQPTATTTSSLRVEVFMTTSSLGSETAAPASVGADRDRPVAGDAGSHDPDAGDQDPDDGQ